MQQTAQVTPELFWDTMVAFQRSAVLKTAVDLEIFTHIGKGATTAKAIAEADREKAKEAAAKALKNLSPEQIRSLQ